MKYLKYIILCLCLMFVPSSLLAAGMSYEDETSYTNMRGSFVDGQAWFDGEVITNLDTSDFSAGVDNYTSFNEHTFTGNHDAISDGTISKDNCLMLAADDTNGPHHAQILKANNGMAAQADFKLTYSFYIPAAQTHTDGVQVLYYDGTDFTALADHGGINGSWITNTVYWSAPETAEMRVMFRQKDGAATTFIGDNDGTGDLLYLHNIVIDSYVSISSQFADTGNLVIINDGAGKLGYGFAGGAGADEALAAEGLDDPTLEDAGEWDDSDANVTQNAGAGTVTWDGLGAGLFSTVDAPFTVGKLYKIVVTIDSITAGVVKVRNTEAFAGTNPEWAAAGVQTLYATCINDVAFDLYGTATCDAVVSNISIKEVTEPNASATHIFKERALVNEGWERIETGIDYNAGLSWNFNVNRLPGVKAQSW